MRWDVFGWAALALLLFAAEAMAPGAFMLWLGLAAAVVFLGVLLVPGIPLLAQVAAFVVLGFIGAGAVTPLIERFADAAADTNAIENWIGRVMVAAYFGFFAFVWIYTCFGLERTRDVPERVRPHP